jgi:2-polyprenyl-3-methyl-5-hydroxy-6-metoxy-1,4-benzoquinol methylase
MVVLEQERKLQICEYYSLWINTLYKKLSPKNRKIFSEYYSNYLNSFDEFLCYVVAQRLSELKLYLEKNSTKKLNILDVGTGTGSESIYMALHNHRVLGIDINEKRLKVARERKKIAERHWNKALECEFKKENLLYHNPEDLYDLIWMEETFHHLEPRSEVLQKLYKLLKKDGLIILTENNAYNPLIQLKLFLKRGFKTVKIKKVHTEKGIEKTPYGNERILSPRELRELMENNGFSDISYRYFRVVPEAFAKLFGTKTTLQIEEVFEETPFIFLFVHYNFAARKN